MEKNLQKPYSTEYNLLIVQDLWQAYYQILLIILLKEFIQLNSNRKNDKNCETCGNKYKNYHCFLEYINFKYGIIEYKCFCFNKNFQKRFD